MTHIARSRAMISGDCDQHPDARVICPACAGARGRRLTSEAKAAAVKRNAEKGGLREHPAPKRRKP